MLLDASFVIITLAIFTIAVSLLAIESKEIVYSLFYFGVFTVLVGLIFFYLGAYYIAVFQIAVYAGAVVALILFAIMLTKRHGEEVIIHSTPRQKLSAAIVSVILFILTSVVLVQSLPVVTFPQATPSLTDILSVVTEHGVIILLIGISLATSLFGSIFALEGGE